MRRTEALPATQQQLLEPSLQDLEVLAHSAAFNTLHSIGGVSLLEIRMDEEDSDPGRDKPEQKPQVDPEIPYYGD